jgi:vacuolar-type H+-ATPase subunit H
MSTAKKAAAKPADEAVEAARNDGVGEQDEVVNPGQEELQKTVDRAEEKGFYGVEIDETPNEHYTIDGVTSGRPTPETDRGGA